MDAIEAIEYVQSKRSIVCPNPGFRLQLAQYSMPFVKAMRKPRQAVVSNDIASRIKNLFPDKATKPKTPTTPTTPTAMRSPPVVESQGVAIATVVAESS